MAEFVHLHVHTYYSLLDGLSSPLALARRAAQMGMPALAITDHGALYGIVQFYQAAEQVGIKPIIGMEAYLARKGMRERNADDRKPYHLVLLAQNQTGYQNLLRLATLAMLEGYYYKPRIDKQTLAEHSEGLIVTSACGSGEIARLIQEDQIDTAREAVAWYRDTFPGRFFLELQDHDMPVLDKVNRHLLAFARELDVPVVATNDVHYVDRQQAEIHDILLCIGTGKTRTDPDRMRYEGDTFYLRRPEEMAALFAEVPEALTNTLRIAEMCDVRLDFHNYHLPIFQVPEGHTPQSYLRALCEQGIRQRYGDRADAAEVRQRLEHELGIIHRMGFDTYFLIVWDLCRAAREQGIWYNARGSAAGSIVAYSLGITMVDPLAHGLIFERFLNPGRVSMPDIDLDFPDDQRERMIEYALNKYGYENVAQIITFGTLGARAAVRDVARVLDIPLTEVDRIAKLIPNIPGKPVSISQALEQVTELRELYETTPYVRELLDTAAQLEGVARHASTHAAGVVIADAPLVTYCPLHRPTKGDTQSDNGAEEAESALKTVTQWPMEDLEAIGLLKVDFLGLSTLTVMRRACELIRERHGVELDLYSIPLNDPAIYELLSSGNVMGVFQVEGAGFRRVLREMRPSRYEHIVAVLALYRPGPMEYIPTYIRRMHGEESIQYHHPALAPILDETYGIIVFQEQIIRIATDLAGYSASEADLLRRAVAKKKKKELLKHREKFLEGAVANGIPRQTAEAIFGDIEYFARYGFNKCLPGDVEIVDAATGRLVAVESLYRGETAVARTLTCDLSALRLTEGAIRAVMDNGVRPVYRLETALGRTLEATANHPFYTDEGWRTLAELRVGDSIAVPRRLPVEGRTEWPEHEVIALAYLLAEGNLRHPHSVCFHSQDRERVEDYIRAAERFPNTQCTLRVHEGTYSVYARRVDRSKPPGIVTWAKRLGIWGKRAAEREIPPGAFELTNRQIALLVARMWEADGYVAPKGHSLYYATPSHRIARQMQHLLLRLGIVARLREVRSPNRGEHRPGYQLFVTGNENIVAFARLIAVHFVKEVNRTTVEAMCELASFGAEAAVPLDVEGLVWAARQQVAVASQEVRQACGVMPRGFYPLSSAGEQGFSRQTLGPWVADLDDSTLRPYGDGDIYWDRVVRIEYAGEKRTYDLEIAGTHNFIANDILVHNSHAADYAVLTCQTAYLKAHYPIEYMTALLTVERHNTEKVGALITECRRMGIEVLPPDVNRSRLEFTIEDRPEGPAIRFGLGAVKNVGDGPVLAILEGRGDRPFRDLDDFCRRVDLRQVNRRALESLIKVGALAPFGPRSRLLAAMDRILGLSAEFHRAREIGQMSLFGEVTGVRLEGTSDIYVGLGSEAEVPQREILEWEKELVGTYLSRHPLMDVMQNLQDVVTGYVGQLEEELPDQMVTALGIVRRVRRHTTRKGDEMAFVTVEDLHGSCDVVVFPRVWRETRELWFPDQILVIHGKVDARRSPPSLVCAWAKLPEEVARPRQAPVSPPRQRIVEVTFLRTGDTERDFGLLAAARELLISYPGEDRFRFYLLGGPNGDHLLEFPNDRTGYCAELGTKLADLVGPDAVRVVEEVQE